MQGIRTAYRQTLARVLLCALIVLLYPSVSAVAAEEQQATFELRPHCNSAEVQAAFSDTAPDPAAVADSTCPSFPIKDPESKQTDILKSGDPLDMDLILHNPSSKQIVRFRAWIAYDSSALEGELLTIAKTFPTPTPGEQSFSAADGFIKLSGTADTPQNGTTIVLAHIRLHSLPGAAASIPITFYDASETAVSHTGIFVKTGNQETNIGSKTLGSLLVRFAGDVPAAASSAPAVTASSQAPVVQTSSTTSETPTAQSSASITLPVETVKSSSSASGTGSAALPAPVRGPTVFNLLQVQHLRVTTEGSSVFLAWDLLPSSEIVGYNLYYGTISGKYIQKRSVDKSASNITIRALTVGTTYYFAVRGVNAKSRETDFSQEVGISVGNPATSTAPLTASAIDRIPTTPKSGGKVSGDTGLPSTFMLFLVLSAVIGTGLAFRRQLKAQSAV